MPRRSRLPIDEESELSSAVGDSEDDDSEDEAIGALMEGAEFEPADLPAPAVSVDQASREFSERLECIADLVHEGKVPEQVYLDLCMSAKNLHGSAKKSAPGPRGGPGAASAALDSVRGRISEIVNDYQQEVDGYREQLTGATLTIDNLTKTSQHNSKCVRALEGVCISAGIPDEKIQQAYARVGVLDQVLFDRASKRKRDHEGAGPSASNQPVVELADSDDD